jgi:hypothetical protein
VVYNLRVTTLENGDKNGVPPFLFGLCVTYLLLSVIFFFSAIGDSLTPVKAMTPLLERGILLDQWVAAALFIVGGTGGALYKYGLQKIAWATLSVPWIIFAAIVLLNRS